MRVALPQLGQSELQNQYDGQNGGVQDQRQLPVDAKHDDYDTDKREELYYNFLRNTEHKRLKRGAVTRDTVDDRTR